MTLYQDRPPIRVVMVFACLCCLALFVIAEAEEPSAKPAIELEGFTEAYRIVNLGAPVDGLLETLAVDRGDKVSKGQVVATLESKVELATLDLAVARTKLEGEIKAQEARVAYLGQKSAHEAKLAADGVLPADYLDQTRTEMALAEAALLSARENLQLAVLEQRRAEAALDQRNIRSPIDGVVVERFLSPGELVTRHNQAKIIGVAQLNPLRVEIIVPVTLFGKITVGARARVTPEVSPGVELDSEVKTVDPVADPASGTFRVRLEVGNTDSGLAAGLKCRVRFLDA